MSDVIFFLTYIAY